MHKQKTQNNAPGISQTKLKNIPPISEGDPVPTPVGASEQWYSEPREKRQRIRQERKKVPTRRSSRLNKSINSPVESASNYCFETRDKDREAVKKDTQQTVGLGAPRVAIPLEMEDNHARIIEEDMNIYPSVPQNTKKTIPSFSSPSIIRQEALWAVAMSVMEERPNWTIPTKMEKREQEWHHSIQHRTFLCAGNPSIDSQDDHEIRGACQRS